jgi:DNA-damage-inducible protein J
MADAIVKSRIDPKLKADAELVLRELGLSVSEVIRLTLRQIVARSGLPFDMKIPNDLTAAAIGEARAMKGGQFDSIRGARSRPDRLSDRSGKIS